MIILATPVVAFVLIYILRKWLLYFQAALFKKVIFNSTKCLFVVHERLPVENDIH